MMNVTMQTATAALFTGTGGTKQLHNSPPEDAEKEFFESIWNDARDQ